MLRMTSVHDANMGISSASIAGSVFMFHDALECIPIKYCLLLWRQLDMRFLVRECTKELEVLCRLNCSKAEFVIFDSVSKTTSYDFCNRIYDNDNDNTKYRAIRDGNKTRIRWGPDPQTQIDWGIPELTGDGDGDGESPNYETGDGAGDMSILYIFIKLCNFYAQFIMAKNPQIPVGIPDPHWGRGWGCKSIPQWGWGGDGDEDEKRGWG
ncbi:hypothetical protein Tco_0571380 [Tanacetum coccineum]